MSLQFNFVVDRIVKNKAYPALAVWQAAPYTQEWQQFGKHWPYTIPVNLYDFCDNQQFSYNLHTIDNYPPGSFYTIALQIFDFTIDYFSLISLTILQHVIDKKLRILFFYDEGDNPYNIKIRLDNLCNKNNLPLDCYIFISANTSASLIPQFAYCPCDELLYWQRNQQVPAADVLTNTRSKEFTVLSRTHKKWRATVMTDLYRQRILDNSYWSYRTDINLLNDNDVNPIEIIAKILKSDIERFLSKCPYSCDQLTSDQHNDHKITELEHFSNSYCSIILETHFDADSSNGAFITEKTFKAIKHGHPFIIVGCAGSLELLRQLGYRTFDHLIDCSYDSEVNNTERWIKIVNSINKIKQQNMHEWFLKCIEDIKYNQQIFLQSKYMRLYGLNKKIK